MKNESQSAAQSCLFCKIAAKEIPAKIIFEDDDLVAFHDISPVSPLHFLVIPKRHIANVMETEPSDAALLGKLLFTAQRLAVEQGAGENGARFVINCKTDGNQTVPHLHMHVLGGRIHDWPPG
jgi:histidine triad (HIT) family protein